MLPGLVGALESGMAATAIGGVVSKITSMVSATIESNHALKQQSEALGVWQSIYRATTLSWRRLVSIRKQPTLPFKS